MARTRKGKRVLEVQPLGVPSEPKWVGIFSGREEKRSE